MGASQSQPKEDIIIQNQPETETTQEVTVNEPEYDPEYEPVHWLWPII